MGVFVDIEAGVMDRLTVQSMRMTEILVDLNSMII